VARLTTNFEIIVYRNSKIPLKDHQIGELHLLSNKYFIFIFVLLSCQKLCFKSTPSI